MKALLIIWAAVVISAVSTAAFVNAEINARVQETKQVQQTVSASELQPANGLTIETVNPQQTINGKYLQGSESINLTLN